jgi:DNA-binding CsgD family transcriptional regulator
VAAPREDDGGARRLAKATCAAYDVFGADQVDTRLRSELRAGGLAMRLRGMPARPSRGWGSLTPSEPAFVQLMSEGITNTATAERLFVSRRTVESHLERVYAKLDLSTRAQLVAAALRQRL